MLHLSNGQEQNAKALQISNLLSVALRCYPQGGLNSLYPGERGQAFTTTQGTPLGAAEGGGPFQLVGLPKGPECLGLKSA